MNNLKKPLFALTVLMLVFCFGAFANPSSTPVPGEKTILSNENVTLTVVDSEFASLLKEVEFDYKTNKLVLQTEKEIAFMQVQNSNGDLEYQLPILSKKLYINFDDFSKGNYSVNLLFSGDNNLVTLSLDKK